MDRMDPDELRQLAKDAQGGSVYFLRDDDDPLMVFMPLGLGALQGAPEEEVAKVGTVYQYLDKAASRSINGRPCFFSVRFLHVDDFAEVRRLWKAIDDAVEEAVAS